MLKQLFIIASILIFPACGDDSAPGAPDCLSEHDLCDKEEADTSPDVSVTPAGNVNNKHGPQGAATQHTAVLTWIDQIDNNTETCGSGQAAHPCMARTYKWYDAVLRNTNTSGRVRTVSGVRWYYWYDYMPDGVSYNPANFLICFGGTCRDVANEQSSGSATGRTGTTTFLNGRTWGPYGDFEIALRLLPGSVTPANYPAFWLEITFTDGP